MTEKTKFSTFIADKKIDPRKIRAVSRKLEGLKLEDRKTRLEKKQGRKKEGGEKKEFTKPRSGRPVTERALATAANGGTLSSRTKTRILKAVNAILASKKAEAVELKALF
ncbi:MAG: hypothetical protein U0174_13255 [Polyangiaceae bacterium]